MQKPGESQQYGKKRVVYFQVAGAESVDRDPKIQAVGGADHTREAWVARQPLERFHNVETAIPGKPEWTRRESLDLSELESHVAAAPLERPFAGDVDRMRNPDLLAAERRFVAYSLACADYAIVQTITNTHITWGWVQIEEVSLGSQGKKGLAAGVKFYKLYLPTIRHEGEMGIFRRTGTRYERIAFIEADTDSPSNIDQPREMPAWNVVPRHVSAVPAPDCAVPRAVEGRPGLEACRSGQANAAMIAHDHWEVNGRVCEARAENNPDVWVQCEARTSAEHLLGLLQFESRKVDGFQLFGELERGSAWTSDAPAIALGDDEGVKVGYAFAAVDGDGDVRAFYKVTGVGTGGEQGHQLRSELDARFGRAPFGSELWEYPQKGITLLLKGYLGNLFLNDGPTDLVSGSLAGRRVQMPRELRGGTLSFAGELSFAFDDAEWWSRVDFSVLYGASPGVDLLLFPFDWPYLEKDFYLGQRLKLFIGAAFSACPLRVTLEGPDGRVSLGGFMPGGVADVGFDVMLSPEWYVRAEGHFRGYGEPNYNDGDEEAVPEWAEREDHFLSAATRAGIGYVW